MKKLLMVTSALDIGGAQRFCLNFARFLNSKGYDYEIIFMRRGKSCSLKQEYIKYNINFKEFNCSSVSRALPKLVTYLLETKPDIILSTIGNVDFICSIAKVFVPKSKLILRKANVIFDNQKNLKTRLQLWFESIVCSKMVALTEEMKNDYESYGFKESNIIVINNMVDLDYISTRLNEKKNIFHKWFAENKGQIIIANARMVQEKRYDILIKAFCEVKINCPEAKLMILGDGKLRKEIEAMIPDVVSKSICLLGFQDNPYYYMTNADLFVLSSDYEGFPNVIIEAFACGLPVISTNCKSGPKEIITNGVEGYIVPTGDAHILAEKISSVLLDKDKCSQMAINAKNKTTEYSINKIGNKYIYLLECLS